METNRKTSVSGFIILTQSRSLSKPFQTLFTFHLTQQALDFSRTMVLFFNIISEKKGGEMTKVVLFLKICLKVNYFLLFSRKTLPSKECSQLLANCTSMFCACNIENKVSVHMFFYLRRSSTLRLSKIKKLSNII